MPDRENDKEIKILSTIFILITVFERSHRYIGKEVIKMKKYVIIIKRGMI